MAPLSPDWDDHDDVAHPAQLFRINTWEFSSQQTHSSTNNLSLSSGLSERIPLRLEIRSPERQSDEQSRPSRANGLPSLGSTTLRRPMVGYSNFTSKLDSTR